MAKRIDLRAYQESIASRLAAAQAGDGAAALLGFASGTTRWLIDLPAAGEVLPPPALTPVPLTQAWFAGLANVHGELATIVDFSLFCGDAPTSREAETGARLLRVGTRQGSNCALLVARVFGLKRTDTLFVAAADHDPAATPTPAWHGEALTDTQGQRWQMLKLAALLSDPQFADAALPLAAAAAPLTLVQTHAQ